MSTYEENAASVDLIAILFLTIASGMRWQMDIKGVIIDAEVKCFAPPPAAGNA